MLIADWLELGNVILQSKMPITDWLELGNVILQSKMLIADWLELGVTNVIMHSNGENVYLTFQVNFVELITSMILKAAQLIS